MDHVLEKYINETDLFPEQLTCEALTITPCHWEGTFPLRIEEQMKYLL